MVRLRRPPRRRWTSSQVRGADDGAEGYSDGEPVVPRACCGGRQHAATRSGRSGGRVRCEERRGTSQPSRCSDERAFSRWRTSNWRRASDAMRRQEGTRGTSRTWGTSRMWAEVMRIQCSGSAIEMQHGSLCQYVVGARPRGVVMLRPAAPLSVVPGLLAERQV